eukprot:m.37584 g.37584  ORF g.37584 m.37584 type:complete len:52 (-) comp13636_c0_seq1:99-254(-)
MTKCLICRTAAPEFVYLPCKCSGLCRKCAQKVATGGFCKACQEPFTGVQKL